MSRRRPRSASRSAVGSADVLACSAIRPRSRRSSKSCGALRPRPTCSVSETLGVTGRLPSAIWDLLSLRSSQRVGAGRLHSCPAYDNLSNLQNVFLANTTPSARYEMPTQLSLLPPSGPPAASLLPERGLEV